jgi:ribosomal protein S1
MSRLEQPTWDDFTARHGVGDVVDGHVTEVVPFGAFVEFAEGIVGLLYGETGPAAGSPVTVRILAVDHESHRMSLAPA